MNQYYLLICFYIFMSGCNAPSTSENYSRGFAENYPKEIIDFVPYEGNPVFAGTGTDTWDHNIRERGYILKEDDRYHMWYTGYRVGPGETMHIGYASSPDGFTWARHAGNPFYDLHWVEDMMVLKHEDVYYMFAEGRDDIAQLLTSTDRINWELKGSLDIKTANGEPLSEGPYGTPTIWMEDDTWYLFYERDDLGIWLATSQDLKVWTNAQDEPVLEMGPEEYDQYGLALNQVVKHEGKYYAIIMELPLKTGMNGPPMWQFPRIYNLEKIWTKSYHGTK